MKAIQGYYVIKPEDLHWRPSNLMKIPNADYLERTGSENLGARLWRLPPKSANTLHKHIRSEEFYFVLEGTGRMRVGDQTLTVPKYGGVLVGPDQLRQLTITAILADELRHRAQRLDHRAGCAIQSIGHIRPAPLLPRMGEIPFLHLHRVTAQLVDDHQRAGHGIVRLGLPDHPGHGGSPLRRSRGWQAHHEGDQSWDEVPHILTT